MIDDIEYKRLRWACKRGMLELDLLLGPFFDNHYLSLSEEEQYQFKNLLTVDDPSLYAWLIEYERTPIPNEYKDIIKRIISLHKTGNSL